MTVLGTHPLCAILLKKYNYCHEKTGYNTDFTSGQGPGGCFGRLISKRINNIANDNMISNVQSSTF